MLEKRFETSNRHFSRGITLSRIFGRGIQQIKSAEERFDETDARKHELSFTGKDESIDISKEPSKQSKSNFNYD
ncbi:MAG: hypothetical protein Fur0015_03880 [Ignavibacteriales bacterium]